jgi:hypothetical protein
VSIDGMQRFSPPEDKRTPAIYLPLEERLAGNSIYPPRTPALREGQLLVVTDKEDTAQAAQDARAMLDEWKKLPFMKPVLDAIARSPAPVVLDLDYDQEGSPDVDTPMTYYNGGGTSAPFDDYGSDHFYIKMDPRRAFRDLDGVVITPAQAAAHELAHVQNAVTNWASREQPMQLVQDSSGEMDSVDEARVLREIEQPYAEYLGLKARKEHSSVLRDFEVTGPTSSTAAGPSR